MKRRTKAEPETPGLPRHLATFRPDDWPGNCIHAQSVRYREAVRDYLRFDSTPDAAVQGVIAIAQARRASLGGRCERHNVLDIIEGRA